MLLPLRTFSAQPAAKVSPRIKYFVSDQSSHWAIYQVLLVKRVYEHLPAAFSLVFLQVPTQRFGALAAAMAMGATGGVAAVLSTQSPAESKAVDADALKVSSLFFPLRPSISSISP